MQLKKIKGSKYKKFKKKKKKNTQRKKVRMMSNKFQLKKFEDYESAMPMQAILAFAKYGFICKQILINENLDDIIQEMITCKDTPG